LTRVTAQLMLAAGAALILLAIAAVAALAYLGVIGGYLALLAAIAIVALAAWNFDRGRRAAARDPYLDGNRADYPVNAGASIRPVPTEAVESPTDRRSPT
jgi:hypothetical protein